MTQLVSADGRASRAASAPLQSPARNRPRSLASVLAGPRAGSPWERRCSWPRRPPPAATASAAVAATAFRVVNDLPDGLYPPAWIVMQLGTLGAAPAAAAVAWLAGDRKLAGRLLAGGTGTWAASKLVKRMVRRPRPATLLPGTHRRGPDATGLGYPSGHAGVAVALGAAALPHLGPAGRALTLAAIPAVGLTRVYVGAHLPLDTAGGAALGLAIDATLALAREYVCFPPSDPRSQHRAELPRDALTRHS